VKRNEEKSPKTFIQKRDYQGKKKDSLISKKGKAAHGRRGVKDLGDRESCKKKISQRKRLGE